MYDNELTDLSSPREPNDLVSVFRHRMTTILPWNGERAQNEARDYKEVGITSVRRLVPALAMAVWIAGTPPLDEQGQTPYQLWVAQKQHDRMAEWVHDDLKDECKLLFPGYGLECTPFYIPCYMVEDDTGDYHLMIESERWSTVLTSELRSDSRSVWMDLASRYSISTIFGQFAEEWGEGKPTIYVPRTRLIMGSDILGRIRERNFLLSIAAKYRMTNFQYLRFRILVTQLFSAGVATNYHTLAEQIVASDA